MLSIVIHTPSVTPEYPEGTVRIIFLPSFLFYFLLANVYNHIGSHYFFFSIPEKFTRLSRPLVLESGRSSTGIMLSFNFPPND